MRTVLVSDIFGRTPALKTLCKTLPQAEADIEIIDPYKGVNHTFKTETAAYACFMNQTGLKKYQSILTDCLTASKEACVLIGFSVGASAIWGISHLLSLKQVQKAFCFYGSQIRHQTHIQPIFDVELIFPEHEPHFDVDDLIKTLSQKNRAVCTKATGLHGFMNELSINFNPVSYENFINYLSTSLIQFRR